MDINLRDLVTFNGTKAPILFYDKNEVCQYGNPAFFDWFGKKREEIVGKMDLLGLLGDSNYQNHHSSIEKALKGEKQSFELLLSALDGRPKEVLISFLPYNSNDHVTGFFLHFTDFTELRQIEKTKPIFEKTDKGIILSFIENSPVPAWIVDPEGIVHYLNEAFKRVKPHIKVGQSFLKSIPTDLAENYQNTNREILALRQIYSGIEKLPDPVQGERVFKVVKFPLLYKNKYMIGGYAIDITEQISVLKPI